MVNREAIRLHELKTPITIHLVTTAACDTVITLAMIVIVRSHSGASQRPVSHTPPFSPAFTLQRQHSLRQDEELAEHLDYRND
jgi:hypothetical protein